MNEHEPPESPAATDQDAQAEHARKMRALKEAQDQKVRERHERRGVVVIHDGDGKGKSTAAFGMAIRAAGHGQRVGLVQFIKGTWKTGERKALERFPEIDHVISGDGFTWNTQDRARDIASAERGFEIARAMVEDSRGDDPKYDLVILDEIHIALRYGYLPLEQVLALVQDRPRELSLVLTGRDAPAALIDAADTVTRMEPVKHAFEAGIRARRGVDF